MYASTRGVLLHAMMEKYAREGSIAEVRFYVTVDGIEFSGSPDLLTEDTVYDYKMTENPPYYRPYTSHKEQLMLNAFLTRNAERWEAGDGGHVILPFDPREHPATQVAVVYLGPKGPAPRVIERKEVYVTPKGKEREGNRPYVETNREVLEWVRPRLHMMAEALDIYPRFPKGAEELWGGERNWECPGPPLCHLPNCLAKRKVLRWDNPE